MKYTIKNSKLSCRLTISAKKNHQLSAGELTNGPQTAAGGDVQWSNEDLGPTAEWLGLVQPVAIELNGDCGHQKS